VRRYGRLLVALGWLVLLPVPVVLFWWAGLFHISRARGALVAHGALHDTTSPGVWAALAVVYLVWMVAVMVGSVWVLDRLGYHYQPYDRPQRPTRRQRRRQRAGMNLLQARDRARRDALREIAAQSKRAAREGDADRRGARDDEGTTGPRRDDAAPGGAADDAAGDVDHERR
jgi:hypothetical protein